MSERLQNRGVIDARSGLPLWQESESFSKERDRLESYFHRLQLQRIRLEQCLTVALPPPPPSSSSLSPSLEPVHRVDNSSSSSSSSSSPSKSNINSDSSSGIDNSPRTNNTTLRVAVDDAAAAALAESTLPTATWSSSFYVEFWRETSQQKLSYVEEKNLAGNHTQNYVIHIVLLT